MSRRFLFVMLALLGACGEAPMPETRQTLFVFGTLVEIVIHDLPSDQAHAAINAVDQAFRRMHQDWHAWKPGELTRLNTAIANGQPFSPSPFLSPLIDQAQRFEIASGGLFNPAIGGLIGLWGFHADTPPEGRALPAADEIQAWIERKPSTTDLIASSDHVFSRNAGVRLDFGGFAKGEAVARALHILAENGSQQAVVNAGGGLAVLGNHGDRPWRVGIRHPGDFGVLGAVELQGGEALMTSGNYERFREQDGVVYSHIIDPRTGYPVAHVASVSVIHSDPALADAASTALTVAGAENWREIATRMGVDLVLFVADDGSITGTPEMLARLERVE